MPRHVTARSYLKEREKKDEETYVSRRTSRNPSKACRLADLNTVLAGFEGRRRDKGREEGGEDGSGAHNESFELNGKTTNVTR